MRTVLAVAMAAVPTVGTIVPASPQPFADVPARRRAAEAMARCRGRAPRGLPGGTFRGGRG